VRESMIAKVEDVVKEPEEKRENRITDLERLGEPMAKKKKTTKRRAGRKKAKRKSGKKTKKRAGKKSSRKKRTRKTYTDSYKARILAKIDAAGRGGKGEIIDNEGLYPAQISQWRKQLGVAGKKKTAGRSRGRAARKSSGGYQRELDALLEQVLRTKLQEARGQIESILDRI